MEDGVPGPLEQQGRACVSHRVQEGVKQLTQGCQAHLIVHLAHFGHENVDHLEEQALRGVNLQEPLLDQLAEPFEVVGLVVGLFEYLEGTIENVPDKHEVLVDPEVVDLVPVLVEDIEAGLKPLLLAGGPLSVFGLQVDEQLRYF